MFGKEIEFPLGGKEGKKKSFFPYVFERGSRKLVVHRRVCMCVEVARTITFPPTFFRFSSSLWILVGKGNFSAGWHSRALVKRRRHSAQLPILSVVRSTSTRERETGEWLIEREREREIKINAGERIIRPLWILNPARNASSASFEDGELRLLFPFSSFLPSFLSFFLSVLSFSHGTAAAQKRPLDTDAKNKSDIELGNAAFSPTTRPRRCNVPRSIPTFLG